jgi:hypothetical protein
MFKTSARSWQVKLNDCLKKQAACRIGSCQNGKESRIKNHLKGGVASLALRLTEIAKATLLNESTASGGSRLFAGVV